MRNKVEKMYMDTPNAAIAINLKVASSSIARAVIAAYHPSVNTMIHTPPGRGVGVAYPNGKGPDSVRWHGYCPRVNPDDRESVLMLVREPVARFASACAERNISDVELKLKELENDENSDVHFFPQSRLVVEGKTRIFQFPDQLNEFASAAGLTLPNIPSLHNRKVPTITQSQRKRIEALYADDLALYRGGGFR